MILSLVNIKGGVGKTTTAVNLAAAFARSELKVLLLDLDPQGSASYALGVPVKESLPSSADLLLEGAAIDDVVRDSGLPGLDLVTGSMELAGADLVLARKREATSLLRKALQPVRRRYDVIIVDCPPGLSVLSLNGLMASRSFIVPVVPHDLDLEALSRLLVRLEELPGGSRAPQLLGILLTMVDHRTKLTDELVARVRRKYGRRVFRTEIPVNVRLAEAPRYGMTIFEYESWSTGGQAYSRLGGESLRRARTAGLV